MGKRFSIRLPDDLAKWLDETARRTGMSRGRIVRAELEKAKSSTKHTFLRLAGVIEGKADLSMRKGFTCE